MSLPYNLINEVLNYSDRASMLCMGLYWGYCRNCKTITKSESIEYYLICSGCNCEYFNAPLILKNIAKCYCCHRLEICHSEYYDVCVGKNGLCNFCT